MHGEGGGTPSWSPFLHVSPPKKSGRPAEWRTRRSPATADFHGAFFFRGRVRRVPLFPVNTAEISGSGVKGKKEETRGQRADFPWKWKAFATPFTDTLAPPVALLSYFRFFRDTFSLASILPAFNVWFPTKKSLFQFIFVFREFLQRGRMRRIKCLMETVIYFLERDLRNARLYVKKFISKRTDGYETRGS